MYTHLVEYDREKDKKKNNKFKKQVSLHTYVCIILTSDVRLSRIMFDYFISEQIFEPN